MEKKEAQIPTSHHTSKWIPGRIKPYVWKTNLKGFNRAEETCINIKAQEGYGISLRRHKVKQIMKEKMGKFSSFKIKILCLAKDIIDTWKLG